MPPSRCTATDCLVLLRFALRATTFVLQVILRHMHRMRPPRPPPKKKEQQQKKKNVKGTSLLKFSEPKFEKCKSSESSSEEIKLQATFEKFRLRFAGLSSVLKCLLSYCEHFENDFFFKT